MLTITSKAKTLLKPSYISVLRHYTITESTRPRPSGSTPVTESTRPQPGGRAPVTESTRPQPGGPYPVTESTCPQPGGPSPVTESTRPQPGCRTPVTESTRPQSGGRTPVNQADLLRVCTILHHQKNSSESRLYSALTKTGFELSHEFFLQVCNKFPLSWRPVYRFFEYTTTRPEFKHTSFSLNRMLGVIGKARNVELFCVVLYDIACRRLANDTTFKIALTTLVEVSELKKGVEFFHLMNDYGVGYSLEKLNLVVESLCRSKHAEEARLLVNKLNRWIEPDGFTYCCLIKGYCDVGDVVEASKVWNLMVERLGFEPDIEAVEAMMVVLFKQNRYDDAMKLFRTRESDLRALSYEIVIDWLCKRAMISRAYEVFDEMRERRGFGVSEKMLGSLVYGLVSRRKVREGYRVVGGVEVPGITLYHGLMKGLLRLKRAGEATEVFREMIRRGCEPEMHTYIMLLQGHMGKRGRIGPGPLVNFDTIFVGGLVKAGKIVQATKFVQRMMRRGVEVPRFDYCKFLYYYSNEDGVAMFEEVGKKMREVGMCDLADIFQRYGEKMATRDRRTNRAFGSSLTTRSSDPTEFSDQSATKTDTGQLPTNV